VNVNAEDALLDIGGAICVDIIIVGANSDCYGSAAAFRAGRM